MYKKVVISILIGLSLLFLGFLLGKSSSNAVVTSENLVGNKNKALTMMLETDVDSNEYEVATSNDWPTDGYIFNAEMSACERGGTLSWDSENNRVLMASGSADKCYVYFDRYTTVRITNVITSNITNNSITLTVEATAGESQIATYYFSSNDGISYEESESNTYTFSNLEQGMEYNFHVYAVDTNGIRSNIYTLSESTLSVVYFANYIKNEVYTGDGNEWIYYHDGVGTYGAYEAGDYSYRYSGDDPNNYICFGSDAATCPDDNLYRIIGVFGDQVKLIKNDYATALHIGSNGDYRDTYTDVAGTSSAYKGNLTQSRVPVYNWSGNSTNQWSGSPLNTVNLNTNYINYLNNQNAKWANMIDNHTWQVGGFSESIASEIVKNIYTNEIVSPATNVTYDAKIGLMYISDYQYAVEPSSWSSPVPVMTNYYIDNNWMILGLREWVITRNSSTTRESYRMSEGGSISSTEVNFSGYFYPYSTVRPVFYLKSNVAIKSGRGFSSNPYRVELV